jgi:hypothetical protein
MAAVFKKNKAKIEAYFAKQDLAAIIPKLRLEDLISKTEEHEINLIESSKRAHTLTKILESKIVNNPDLFQNLKQFLGSIEDFNESPQPETSTIVPSSDGEPGISQQTPTDPKSPQTTLATTTQIQQHPKMFSVFSKTSTGTGEASAERDPLFTTPDPSTLPVPVPGRVLSLRRLSMYMPSRSSLASRPLTTREEGAWGRGYSPSSIPVSTSKTNLKKPTSQVQQSEAFPGIDFSSYRSHAMVGHRGSTIRGEGVQLRIPPKAIKKRISLDISLQGCISGPFSLPEGIQLASPVFLVTCTPQYQFQRELTLTIQHFVLLQNREQCKDMVLLTSPEMKAEDKHYICWKFDFCDQSLIQKCFPHASYGEVELSHCSFFCFGIRLSRGESSGLSIY